MSAEPIPTAAMARSSLGPVGTSERIDSIDVLRGVAVLGILTINIFLFGLPVEMGKSPVLLVAGGQADVIAYFVAFVALEGSQRAIFSMLFGAGVVLFTSRLFESDRASFAKRIYYTRTCWLIVFGLVDAYLLLWFGDILFHYGVAGLVLYFARDWRPRKLLIVACAILGALCLVRIGISASFGFAKSLVDDPSRAAQLGMDSSLVDELTALVKKPSSEAIQQSTQVRAGGYISAFLSNARDSLESQTANAILMLFWDALALMMIGMALFKWKVLNASRSTMFYALMFVLGIGVGYAINWWEVHDAVERQVYVTYFEWTYDIGRIATALGYVGLVMLVCKLQILSRLRSWLAAVGRMALSNYVMQTIICNTIFVIFGLYGSLRLSQLYIVVLCIWIVQLIYSPLWLARFKYGPLEWVWRKLTYAKISKQPLTMR